MLIPDKTPKFTETSLNDISKPRLDRYAMAARAARELKPGSVVNLGFGIPTLVSMFVPEEAEVIFHSENGLVGCGSVRTGEPDSVDPYCINAGGQPVHLVRGASYLSHHESFELIRGGWIDVSILGALQVGTNGDLANHHVPSKPAGSIGGAQDLAFCSKRVVVLMRHQDRVGRPKLVEHVSLPLTGPRCVDLVITDIAVVQLRGHRAILREVLGGWTPDEVQAVTGIPLDLNDATELTI